MSQQELAAQGQAESAEQCPACGADVPLNVPECPECGLFIGVVDGFEDDAGGDEA